MAAPFSAVSPARLLKTPQNTLGPSLSLSLFLGLGPGLILEINPIWNPHFKG